AHSANARRCPCAFAQEVQTSECSAKVRAPIPSADLQLQNRPSVFHPGQPVGPRQVRAIVLVTASCHLSVGRLKLKPQRWSSAKTVNESFVHRAVKDFRPAEIRLEWARFGRGKPCCQQPSARVGLSVEVRVLSTDKRPGP